tara:strand:- start:605 stop:805 length:201 start_codon:yes stop_codon:yes gene_type:complete
MPVYKKLAINTFIIRYKKLPKEVKQKVTYDLFIKNPSMIENIVETAKNVAIGRKLLRLKYGNFNFN